jgi:hypothetical protein
VNNEKILKNKNFEEERKNIRK